MSESAALRRAPSQARSRERVEKMLAAAVEIIAAQGSDALRMSEVAETAGVSIGSLYQFFPDKAAIIRTLAARYNEEGRRCIADELGGVRDADSLRTAFGRLIDIYYAAFLAEPVRRDVWSGMMADPGLRAFELAESRGNAALLAAAMLKVRPRGNRRRIEAAALAIMVLGEQAMRLAVSLPRAEGDAVIEAYKRMAMQELA
ncbi:TetR family transcriptional regulator [Dongia mobilis]|uniref:TetR family transcriptional regulator n=1 Tax=Dongia mobilis TaxID=578943 RepID=A0A4R6WPE7_9PROT|nr:TetR/AcrR family transcriptional regulator [Dongia mobilis]TDQ83064.1 TetR family transcriptional regulator [Dongia mobilis]